MILTDASNTPPALPAKAVSTVVAILLSPVAPALENNFIRGPVCDARRRAREALTRAPHLARRLEQGEQRALDLRKLPRDQPPSTSTGCPFSRSSSALSPPATSVRARVRSSAMFNGSSMKAAYSNSCWRSASGVLAARLSGAREGLLVHQGFGLRVVEVAKVAHTTILRFERGEDLNRGLWKRYKGLTRLRGKFVGGAALGVRTHSNTKQRHAGLKDPQLKIDKLVAKSIYGENC